MRRAYRILRCFYCGSRQCAELAPGIALCGRALAFGLTLADVRRDLERLPL